MESQVRETPFPAEWHDFVALGEDDLRELIDGELLEVEVPTKLHEWVVAYLLIALGTWARRHGGLLLGSGYKIRVSARRGVMPDLQYFRPGREQIGGEQGLTDGAPDLVIEVVSQGSRRYDRVIKLGWYRELGVPEYWIVDPEAQTIEQLVLDGSSYRIASSLAGESEFVPASFPELTILLRELWTIPGSQATSSGS